MILQFIYRIHQIKNLDALTQLDVLELNGNQVSFRSQVFQIDYFALQMLDFSN